MRMGSHVFFNGMAIGEMNKINIEDGKTLMIKYIGLGGRGGDGGGRRWAGSGLPVRWSS